MTSPDHCAGVIRCDITGVVRFMAGEKDQGLVQESDAGRTAKDEKSGTDICVHEMNMVRH